MQRVYADEPALVILRELAAFVDEAIGAGANLIAGLEGLLADALAIGVEVVRAVEVHDAVGRALACQPRVVGRYLRMRTARRYYRRRARSSARRRTA